MGSAPIPTAIVAYGDPGDAFGIYSNTVTGHSFQNSIKRQMAIWKYGLNRNKVGVRPHETVVIKRHNDLFNDKRWGNFLRATGKEVVLLSGRNSSACIPKSAEGGTLEGFKMIVIPDRLADNPLLFGKEPEDGGLPNGIKTKFRKTCLQKPE